MAGNEPFLSTTYNVGTVPKAFSSDIAGNLIFSDIPNPSGITLTQLIEGVLSGNIKFDSSGTFFTDVDNIADALKYLNLFAYIKDTGRFLVVDPTISDDKILDGEIYNSLQGAIDWIDDQITNGYNTFNILLMGTHKAQGVLEQDSNLGVYEIDGTADYIPTVFKRNGIKIIGVGNPVIRAKNFVGSALSRKWVFQVDSDGVENKINVSFENVSFEFVDCDYTSLFIVSNAPNANTTKERNGFFIKNSSLSFSGGSNRRNRFVDIQNATNKLPSQISIEGFKLGSIVNTVASSEPIECFYLDHDEKTTLSIKDWEFSLSEQPNPLNNTDITNTTSFLGIVVNVGNVVTDNINLDEKFYWNGGLFSNVITRLLQANNIAHVSMSNTGVVRNSFNTINENAGGITCITDWINVSPTTNVNIDGFDTYLNVDVIPVSSSTIITSGTSGTPTSGTSGTPGTSGISGTFTVGADVKPVKSFWNKDEVAFGIGHLGELRFGKLDSHQILKFKEYSLNYGIPFAYNEDIKKFQYWNGTSIVALGDEGGGGGGSSKTYIGDVTAPQFTPTSYSFDGGATFLGFEYTVSHNTFLTNKNTYTINVVETVSGRKMSPQEIISIDENNVKIVLASPENITVTIIGF